jgi:hypothetical protein
MKIQEIKPDKIMKVTIKKLNITSPNENVLEIKKRGMELEVRAPDGKHLGDLLLTEEQVIWCKGKTTPPNGKSLSWEKFIKMMQSQ